MEKTLPHRGLEPASVLLPTCRSQVLPPIGNFRPHLSLTRHLSEDRLLPSGKRYRIPKCKLSGYKYSFIPLSIKELNQFYPGSAQLDRMHVACLSCVSDCMSTRLHDSVLQLLLCVSGRRKVASRSCACIYVCVYARACVHVRRHATLSLSCVCMHACVHVCMCYFVINLL